MRSLRILLPIVLGLALLPSIPAGAGSSTTSTYIVSLRRDRNPEATAAEHNARYGVKAERYFHSAIKGYSTTTSEERAARLRDDPSVLTVSKSRTFHAAAQTVPTGVSRVDADTVPGSGEGVYVAVMDSGIDLQHPDLAANIAGGTDCDGADTGNYDDQNGHGTHVAGTIAAIDNSIGVRGVAASAKLYAVRILDKNGSGTDVTILCGLEWIYNRAPTFGGVIRVANMSLEAAITNVDDGNCGYTIGDPVHQGICAVVGAGVTFVVAAGNHNDNIKDVAPAAYDEVITATALSDWDGAGCGVGTDLSGGDFPDDTFASFSSFATLTADKDHTIGAPGVNIFSTWRTDDPQAVNDYQFSDGTSMSSPHIAGAAARYIQTHPGASPATVLAALKEVAEPEDVDFNGECGGGVFSHTDPSAKHAEPVLRVAEWSTPIEAATPGVVRGNNWYLNNEFIGAIDISLPFGSASDRKIVGDWDSDGIDTPGLVRGNIWYVTNGFDASVDMQTALGSASDRIVAGDWDGDGDDTPGVVRGNVWYLSDEFDGGVDHTLAFGSVTDKAVVGDWDGDGDDTPGVVRGNVWYLKDEIDGSAIFATIVFGKTTDRPIVGDWEGDGDDDVGITRGNLWALKGTSVFSFNFGLSTDFPVAGDWNGATT